MIVLYNLSALHDHEEKLSAQSLAAIKADAALSEHWLLVAEAMNVIYVFTHDYKPGSEDGLTLQYLGIRLFNAGATSIKLALSGYYQTAFQQLRDLDETSFLIDYLKTYPEKIDKWRGADKKQREELFAPRVLRKALDERDGYKSKARAKIYGLLSELASHPTFSGVALLRTGADNMASARFLIRRS
jgi:hypothetical protein